MVETVSFADPTDAIARVKELAVECGVDLVEILIPQVYDGILLGFKI